MMSRLDRWLALPMFVLALLSKESVLLLPVVVLAARTWPDPSHAQARPRWDAPLVIMVLISIAFLVYLGQPRATGIRFETGTTAAYGLTFGAPLFQNLTTYAGWTADLAMLKPGMRFVDARNPDLYAPGAIVLIGAGIACAFRPLRSRGWAVGCMAFLALIIPVLPLEHHTYRYYLYSPLLAAGLCVAAIADLGLAALRRRIQPWNPGVAWGLAAIVAIALTWNGARLVAQMATRPSPVYPGMFGDPIVDRAHIAKNVVRSLRAASLPPRAELGFVMRERLALIGRIERGSSEAPVPDVPLYPETNVQAAILDGLAIGALVPGVAAVSFEPPVTPPGPAYRYVVYAPTGESNVYTAAGLDSLLMSNWIYRW